MPKRMTSREIISRLGKEGWVRDRQKGSHIVFRHPDRPGARVTVVHPKKDFKAATLHSIFRAAGWERSD